MAQPRQFPADSRAPASRAENVMCMTIPPNRSEFAGRPLAEASCSCIGAPPPREEGSGGNARMANRAAPCPVWRHERHTHDRSAVARSALGSGHPPRARRLPLRRHHHGRVLPAGLPVAAAAAQERPLLPHLRRGRGRRLPRLQALRSEGRAGPAGAGGGAGRLRLHRGVGGHPLAGRAGGPLRLLALPLPAHVP